MAVMTQAAEIIAKAKNDLDLLELSMAQLKEEHLKAWQVHNQVVTDRDLEVEALLAQKIADAAPSADGACP